MDGSAIYNGIHLDWDVPIEMDDGLLLRADVFRPASEGRYPVLMTYGPYCKGLPFKVGWGPCWRRIETAYPEILQGTTGRFMCWETVDPEKWVPEGYVCLRIDSRGAGRSPGYLDVWSRREAQDYYQCIEWAAVQPWSTGKIGLLGISYYAMNQWQVATLHPPHLSAICPFEGCNDFYREGLRHGGIKHMMFPRWYATHALLGQHGVGERGAVDPNTGYLAMGPETLPEEELAANRADFLQDTADELINDWCRERTPDLGQVKAPLLSCANWGGNQLHSRGNIEGYLRAGSEQKWLEVHGLEHFTEFYTDYGRKLQQRFFDHFLKGLDTWSDQAPVHLRLRNVDGTFTDRDEQEWPLARTRWTKFYLDADNFALTTQAPRGGTAQFSALSEEGLSFWSRPLEQPMEITGPMAAKLFVASSTTDADVFLTVRVQAPDGKEVTFVSANDPKGVIATGWLRASHRKLDPTKSCPYRPWHTHDELQRLVPGETYELDVEIWPTSIIVPAGYRVGITVTGVDFEFPGPGPWLPGFNGIPMRGAGVYRHDAPERPTEIYGGRTSVVSSREQLSYVLVPVIPSTAVQD